jgi:hypothetical protein
MGDAVSIRNEPRKLDALVTIDGFESARLAPQAFHIDSELLAVTLTG